MAAEGEAKLMYRSPGYADSLLVGLHQLQKDGKYVDVTLQVGGEVFPVHRCVLSASCEYFCAMFGGGLVETRKSEITIHHVSPHTFSLIVDFLYTGQVLVTETNCLDLFTAADMLRVGELVEACSSFLKSQLCAANAFGSMAPSPLAGVRPGRGVGDQR